ncbi:Cytochrome c oxidase subunit 3 [Variovorax sp. PBL-H6]|uniref:cytochrome c oxidase subunit 3 n=1 Tax=Variovorax sp. PBL-H6 TaxID=434009 RepID=UPI0013162A25|nr:cytochrome c oxidase subunit 3 [Variovorax sp. PBL-H6]VTU21670.1 Cytochrome c oxidase subunit 3 [Variovorax sp. PBL-H6]
MSIGAWPAQHPHEAEREAAPPREIGVLGMWVFLATELLFFGVLFVAYLYGRTHWPQGFGAASRHTDVLLGTLNTGLLLTSSAAVALAVACADNQAHRRLTARLLWATAGLGAAFLLIKGIEYRHEGQEGLFPGARFHLQVAGAQLFFMLYFLTTGLHAVHLVIGIAGIAALAWGSARGRPWAAARHVDAMALYWHFVDVVWIFLYPILYLVERHS